MKPKTLPQQLKRSVDSYRRARKDRHKAEARRERYSSDIRHRDDVSELQKLVSEFYIKEESLRMQVLNLANAAHARQKISYIKYKGIMREYGP